MRKLTFLLVSFFYGVGLAFATGMVHQENNSPLGAGQNILKKKKESSIPNNYGFNQGSMTETPDYFTPTGTEFANYKWVRMTNANEPLWAAKAIGTQPTDYVDFGLVRVEDESQLWAFVGSPVGGFKIYNKAYPGYVLTASSGIPADGVNTFLSANPAVEVSTWVTDDQWVSNATAPGFGLLLKGKTGWSLNKHTGKLRFYWYQQEEVGSRWIITPVTRHSITITQKGKNPYSTNYRYAKLDVTYGNTTTAAYPTTKDQGEMALYIPTGLTPDVTVSYQYHGYTNNKAGNTFTFTVDTNNQYQYLWYEHPDYQFYRIPAITTNRRGELIAFSDYRHCHNDIGFGRVDQGMRYSTDNGKTWSDPVVIETMKGDAAVSGFYKGFGDPAIVADRESDRVLLMTVAGDNFYGFQPTNCFDGKPNYFARFYSEDGGKTWSAATDVTKTIYDLFATDRNDADRVEKAFIGSGRIFQSSVVKVGTYYRLYAALCAAPSGNRVIYSDDFGMTWHVLGGKTARPAPGGDEPKCEELPDGSVILSSRKYHGRVFNIYNYSQPPTTDNPASGAWAGAVDSHTQTGGISVGANSTNGEIMIVKAMKANDKKVYTVALQSLPFAENRSQVGFYWKDITDKASYQQNGVNNTSVFASNWTRGLQVENIGYSAYSTMTLQADGKVGFFYEESPGIYAMVYIPLSISEITGGVYDRIIMPKSLRRKHRK